MHGHKFSPNMSQPPYSYNSNLDIISASFCIQIISVFLEFFSFVLQIACLYRNIMKLIYIIILYTLPALVPKEFNSTPLSITSPMLCCIIFLAYQENEKFNMYCHHISLMPGYPPHRDLFFSHRRACCGLTHLPDSIAKSPL